MGERVKSNLNQGETDSVEIGRRVRQNVAYHLYYLTYVENIQLKLKSSRLEEGLLTLQARN
jgi:hypothetical protein